MEENVTPMPKNIDNKAKIVWGVIIGIFAIVWLFTGIYVVDETEQAVVLRFGKFLKIEEPGLNTQLPFGIDKNYKVPTQRELTLEFGHRISQSGTQSQISKEKYEAEANMLTGDLNIIYVTWTVHYRIGDPKAWLFNVTNEKIRNPLTGEYVNNKERTIRDISQSVINQLVGDRSYDSIDMERQNIQTLAVDKIQNSLSNYMLGVTITEVKLLDVLPPAGDVQDAFEDVNKASQDMEALINAGKEAYNKEIPKARGEARQMLEEAEGYKARRVNTAKGDVARFNAVLVEYRRAPGVTRDRLYYEMIEEVFANSENVEIIDKNLENFLPLKNLQKGAK